MTTPTLAIVDTPTGPRIHCSCCRVLLPCSPDGVPFADHHRLTVDFSSSERGTHTWNIHITVWECGTWTIDGDREMRKVLTRDEYSDWLCEFWSVPGRQHGVTFRGELYRDAYPERFPQSHERVELAA